MPIWKLEPQDLTSPRWGESTHHREVIVRAPTEQAARGFAAVGLRQWPLGRPGVDTSLESPWHSPDLVRCTQLTDSPYAEDGTPGVLVPKGHLP
jgi:hypothetical protein